MADRYWVGGTANWDATAGTKWSTTSGGAGGASVPTSADDVYFDAASGTVTVTVSATATCRALNFTGFTGTFTGSSQVQSYGSLVCGLGMTWSYTGTLVFVGPGTLQITCNGKTLGPIQISSTGTPTVELQDAFASSGAITVSGGTFTTNNYNVTATSLASSNSNTRTINLGSSTVTLSASSSVTFNISTGLTFNAGTSNIVCTGASPLFNGGGMTFYNVSITSTSLVTPTINSANTFNNLSIAGRTSAGIATFSIGADQTINGTLTLSAGTNATMRTFVRSNTIGETRTLTCAAVASLTDIDFGDITIAGAAAPVSGTRLGDCKGNSGITFPAAKMVYWVNGSGNISQVNSFATSSGGVGATNNFCLAQDTAVFDGPSGVSGFTVTVNAAYNIGTIDMSARTSNTMTLSCTQSPSVYGDWINGTGTTLSGTGRLTFAGRGAQTITSAGKSFTQAVAINSPSGAVTLQDAYTSNRSAINAVELTAGTFAANGYSVTLTGAVGGFKGDGNITRTLALGSGTWTIAGAGNVFDCEPATNLTVTGTGAVSLTNAAGKNFIGGNIQTYPTINQGGTGTLTITGSNKFADITNTAIGRVQFTGGTTNEFTAFNLNGVSGNLLQVGSTNTTQAILKAPSWNVGANSTDAGNNTGLTFSAGTVDYLSVSYINGQVSAPTSSVYYGATNITAIYYGSTPVSAIYYGSNKVF